SFTLIPRYEVSFVDVVLPEEELHVKIKHIDMRQGNVVAKVETYDDHMTPEFKGIGVADLVSGKLMGICATDSFGMGIDLKDIDLVIQWRTTCDPCMGCTGRDKSIQATVLLLVEMLL
ncbi:hypothetical protein BDM02DRAFT_3133435, partial [Thelephora ganbajun]